MDKRNLEVIMGLIIHAGDAKSGAMEAIQAAKTGDFDQASERMKAAEIALIEAHRTQSGLLTQEAQGDSVELSLMMVHGQDHLMTAIAFLDLAKEMLDLHKKIDRL